MNNSRGAIDSTLAAMFSNEAYKNDYLFYAHMIGQCSIKIGYDINAPAGIAFILDHYELYINPNKFDEHSLVGRLAILKHEMLHILYNHHGRTENRVHSIWNEATDCAINQLINREHLPKVAITPETLCEYYKFNIPHGLSSEEYYEIIKNEKIKQQAGDTQNSKTSEQELLDTHNTWEESHGDPDLRKDITQKLIEKAHDSTLKSIGNIPKEYAEWLELYSTKAEVDWRNVLRKIVGNKRVNKRTTIMRRDRRFPHRKDLRGKVKDRIFNLLVILDVSASMSDEALLITINEVRSICELANIEANLIQVDTDAHPSEKLTKNTKLIKRKACGGTNLSPAIEMAYKEKLDFDVVVVVTDGQFFNDEVGNFDAMNKYIFWLIEPGGEILQSMYSRKMTAFKLKG